MPCASAGARTNEKVQRPVRIRFKGSPLVTLYSSVASPVEFRKKMSVLFQDSLNLDDLGLS